MKIALRNILVAVCLLAVIPLMCVPAQQEKPISDSDMKVIDFEDVKYPVLARDTNTQGVVVVRVRLDNDGKVVEATALSGFELLVQECLANAKKWRFKPNARRAAVIVYNFRLIGLCKSSAVSFSTLQEPNFVTITRCIDNSVVEP
jgi:TonB family protein